MQPIGYGFFMQKTITERLTKLFVTAAIMAVPVAIAVDSVKYHVREITHLYNSQSITNFLINRIEQQEELRRQGRLPRPEPDTHGFLSFRG